MNDRMQILEDLDVLVRMCRSKSDGAALVIEEEEIKQKLNEYKYEKEELKNSASEENYDTSAEMADRNIEIITKKIISTIKIELKNKNQELQKLKEKEREASDNITSLKNNKKSHEVYISSMQERISSTSDDEVINRYNSLIAESEQKVKEIAEELAEKTKTYTSLQDQISKLAKEIGDLNKRLKAKQEQLLETQHNLENKDTYIDQTKLERNNKKLEEINSREEKLNTRLEEISSDPKYLEIKIKKIINENGDMTQAKNYLISLITKALEQPYMNVAADNALEEELLRATQARDTFANEIEQKNYNIMETESPEQIRIEYLNERINYWNNDLQNYEQKISQVDKDEQFNYHDKDERIAALIASLKEDYNGFKKAYEEEPDTNMSAKAALKVSFEEKKEDLANAEKIAAQFKNDEAEDIKLASSLIKNECEKIKNNINAANEEINNIKNKLMSRKSGIIDINAQNKDKDRLKELADKVMAIKHRRQFAEQPEAIARRLESLLNMNLITDEMLNKTQEVELQEENQTVDNYQTSNEISQPEEQQNAEINYQPEEQNGYNQSQQEYQVDESQQYEQSVSDYNNQNAYQPEVQQTYQPEVQQTSEQYNQQPVYNQQSQQYEQQINNQYGQSIQNNMNIYQQPQNYTTEQPVVDLTQQEPVQTYNKPVVGYEEPVSTIDQYSGIQQLSSPIAEQVDTTVKNDNIVSSNIADELDQYINSLGNNQQ